MINYVFPGTFDPITYGHLAVIQKFLEITSENDQLFFSISESRLKKPILSFEERFELANSIISKKNDNIFVEKITGNTAEFIHKKKGICLRGIRNLDDLKYESYWPVSRSSNHPVDIFLLIPVFNEESQYISSTFFKNQIADLLLKQNKSYKTFYNKLSKIAPLETINLFYEKYFGLHPNNNKNKQQINLKKSSRYSRISCLVADHNIVDYGQIEFIKNSLNLSDKLIVFVPEIIQHQRIEFNDRFKLIEQIIKTLNDPKIEIISCQELTTFNEIEQLMKKYEVNQFFLEVREYHTRNEDRLKIIFEQMHALFRINIDLIIILQEKYRDISQPLLFNIGYDDQASSISNEKTILNKYIPQSSLKTLRRFIKNN